MSNNDKGSFLGLNESDDVVETVLDKERFLCFLSSLALSRGRCSSTNALLLLLLGFRAVLVKKLEELGGRVLVEGVGELRDGGRNLQALVKDNLLTLEANVLGPFDEASQVSLRANILTNAKIFGGGLEERVLLCLCLLASTKRSGGRLFAGSWLGFGGLVIETKSAMVIQRMTDCASELYCHGTTVN